VRALKTVLFAMLAMSVAISGPALAQSPGRLLASNCFQCHGTNGKPTADGFERLAGMPENEIFNELMEMRQPPSTVEPEEEIMAVHANGFTEAELHLIAQFFAKQQ
jgi:cytochrome subunit of sulfide dehydrogenase